MQTVNLFDNVIGVSEALNFAKVALEGVTLVVQGEITGINTGKTYSAVYFSVKDSKSVMQIF